MLVMRPRRRRLACLYRVDDKKGTREIIDSPVRYGEYPCQANQRRPLRNRARMGSPPGSTRSTGPGAAIRSAHSRNSRSFQPLPLGTYTQRACCCLTLQAEPHLRSRASEPPTTDTQRAPADAQNLEFCSPHLWGEANPANQDRAVTAHPIFT